MAKMKISFLLQEKTIEDWDDQISVFRKTSRLNVLELTPLHFSDESSRVAIAKLRAKGMLPLLTDVSGIQFRRGHSNPFIQVDQSDEWCRFPIFKNRFNPSENEPTRKDIRGIPEAKKTGILSLCRFMNPSRRPFWHNIHVTESRDLQVDDDE